MKSYLTPWERAYSHEARESIYGGMCSGEILKRLVFSYSPTKSFHILTQYCSLTQGATRALISSDDS